jgi:adenylate cyclase class IV
MAKDKEIEIKWNATKITRHAFNRAITSYCKGKRSRFVHAEGFDYYHTNSLGYVIRHRHGACTNELTVKARVSGTSTTVRKETNVTIAKSSSPIQIQEFATELGFRKVLPIYKDCDIYYVEEGKYLVDVVWYRVTCANITPRLFMEVEVHDAPEATSLKILNKWKTFMTTNFGLTDKDIIHNSLYEIYSGNRYRMSRSIGKKK